MKNKKLVFTFFLTLVFSVIVIVSKNFGSTITDNYFNDENIDRYNQHLSTTINSVQQLQKELSLKENSNLDSFNKQICECIINLRETSVTIDYFEIGLNRKNDKMIYGLNPIEAQLENYSIMLSNQTNIDGLILDTDKISEDLRIIQESNVFSENQYEKIKNKWNLVIEKLNIKPTSSL